MSAHITWNFPKRSENDYEAMGGLQHRPCVQMKTVHYIQHGIVDGR